MAGVSSFDFAAASVVAPLKYQSSFDSSYFNSGAGGESFGEDSINSNGNGNGNEQYHSDRVTLLSEDSENQTNVATRNTRSSRRRSFKPDHPGNNTSNSNELRDQLSGTKRATTSSGLEPSTSLPILSAEKRRRVEEVAGPVPSSSFDSQPLPAEAAAATATEDMQFIDLLHRNQDVSPVFLI